VTATIPAVFRGRARRDAAAFYLTQLAKGVLAGELRVLTGHGQTALITSEFLVLEIEVKQKKRANHVGIKLRWPKRPHIRIAVRGAGRQSAGDGIATPSEAADALLRIAQGIRARR
jgi:amphi-Trp domain-containing protein